MENKIKLRSIEREISLRRRVYPRWVAAGRLKQAEADHEIRVMEAIADDYRKHIERDEPGLFY